MDNTNLKRDKTKILVNLKETPNGSIITLKDCIVQFPSRFINRNLGEINVGVEIYGLFIIIMDENYSLANFTSKVILNSNIIEYVMIDDVEYINVYFKANDVMIINTSIVKDDKIIFDILDEVILKGNIPWYVTYEDLLKMLDTTKEYAGMNITNLTGTEILTSMCARCFKNKNKYYRLCQDDKVYYIGLRDVFYSATSTLTKLSGSYFKDGVISALLTPTKTMSELEKAVRA